MATTRKPEADRPVEACLAELLDHLGIVSAHFAGRGSADLQGFASRNPERMASLTLLCPAVLDPPTLALLAGRLLVVTGDHGPGARRPAFPTVCAAPGRRWCCCRSICRRGNGSR
jgi:hypothetical protein